jgi:hypothetical protein
MQAAIPRNPLTFSRALVMFAFHPSSRARMRISPTARKWLLRSIKYAIIGLVSWGVFRALVGALSELNQYRWAAQPEWLLVSGCLYLVGQFPSGVFWHRVLISLGQRTTLARSLRAYYIGHIGKYVPGKAMVVVLRASLVKGPGVDAAVAAASVFYETLTSMAVAAMVAAGVLAIWLRGPWHLVAVSLGLMVLAALPTFPPVFLHVLHLVGRRWSDPGTLATLRRLDYATIMWGWLSIAGGWIIMGLSLWAAVRAFTPAAPPEMPRYTAGVALSTVAGFVAMIPAGAGIRELVLTEVLAEAVGATPAFVSAIVLRLVSILAELAISSILYPFGKPAQPTREARTSKPEQSSKDHTEVTEKSEGE